ncbi:MAG TPA: J domain-containing protein, partial [Hyphomicrobiaceae bacterium]|nr:J domain-containing protein [Hyphomicrobiaceae bacterium]
MREETALELAVGLLQLPSRARALRDAPLPRDVDALLAIVAGEGRASADAARLTGLPETKVGDAAGFYIEQILLHPDADSYRALGA